SQDAGHAPMWAQRFSERWNQRRSSMSDAAGHDTGGAAAGGGFDEDGGFGNHQSVVLEALHELLAQTRQTREGVTAAGAALNNANAQQRSLNQREMMSVLSLLQATPSATLRAAVGEDGESLAQRLKSEVLSGATRLGVDPAQAHLDPQDEDAIDLVGMLFD